MRWIYALLLAVLAGAAQAQGAATLVADTVTVSQTDGAQLQATGNVQVYYDGTTLSAAAIIYDQRSDRLTITGPILIRTPEGAIITADRAEIEPTLENGILRGARLILDRQLQLAANSIDRIDGRYSALTRAAATSCVVCGNRPPLWSIRADRVIHDEVERQLYFENATFRIRGVPVAWIPRIRLPDPTLDRATGLLIPTVRTTSELGIGIKLPYFIALGPSRDLTLTPYVSGDTRTLEARYRQAFMSGTLEVNAAISQDDILNGVTRAYVFAAGAFDLGRGFRLDVDLESVSDAAYLLDYGYSDKDRLDSAVTLTRVRTFDLLYADLTVYDSLRDDEPNAELPPFVAELTYERRIVAPLVGGVLTYGASFDAFERTSDSTGDSGRDMARVGVDLAWQRQTILGGGFVLDALTALDVDYFAVRNDPEADSGARAVSSGAVTLRWPLIRRGAAATHLLEPQVSLGWTAATGIAPPVEDATLTELDEGNLMALTRFPGQDATETGWRSAVALTYTRIAPDDTAASLTFGRLLQSEEQDGFSPASGLASRNSDWLLAGHLDLAGGFGLDARALFDDTFNFSKTEARIDWANERIAVAASYHYLPADPTRERLDRAEEWTVDAAWTVNDNWRLNLGGRYDVARDAPAEADIGLRWRNECVTVDLSLSRRYTFNDAVDPSTDVGFSISLDGFSARGTGSAAAAACAE